VFPYTPCSEVIWGLNLSIRGMSVALFGRRPLYPTKKIPQYPLNSWLDGPLQLVWIRDLYTEWPWNGCNTLYYGFATADYDKYSNVWLPVSDSTIPHFSHFQSSLPSICFCHLFPFIVQPPLPGGVKEGWGGWKEHSKNGLVGRGLSRGIERKWGEEKRSITTVMFMGNRF
jgi:hypothetical protein